MRLGVLAYPAFIIILQLSKPSAVPAYEKAGAYAAESSRRPASLNVPAKAVRKAVRRHLLIPVGDGRYYLDRDAVRRADRRTMAIMIGAGLAFIPLVWLMFR